MFRTGRTLALGCLLILQPLLAQAGGNSLLIPATGRCALNTVPEELQQALAACQQVANGGDAEAQYELGEFFYDGERIPRDLQAALNWFEKASLQGHAQA
ncbi:MAG: sel1 repeat family protein, partial [Pseudomonas aeruginosa]|nr:sel1 repeat family protein [Pseudomonas aeruginosa]